MIEMIANPQHLLRLNTNGIIRFVAYSEIIYAKAEGNYTCFVLKDLSQFAICKTLLNSETILGHLFIRCHKSYLINTIHIREINTRNRQILLTTGEIIPYSRSKAKILEEKMKIRPVLNFQM